MSTNRQSFRGHRFGPYIVEESIGRGSFGKVKLATHEKTGVQVALKVISRKTAEADARSKLKLQREIRILRLLNHPHVMKLYDVVQTRNDIVLVLELVSGGELYDYLLRRGRLSENLARAFFQQLISVVLHCHNLGVSHRDIKPENIMLTRDMKGIKLGDFGLSSISHDGKMFDTSCGTPNYASPEVVSGRLYQGKEADIWSCGVVLYTMLAGALPFDSDHFSVLFKKIQTAKYTMPSFLSESAQDLIQKILVVDPLQRATGTQILNHPWVRQDFPVYLALIHRECLDENEIFPTRCVTPVPKLLTNYDSYRSKSSRIFQLILNSSYASSNVDKKQNEISKQKEEKISLTVKELLQLFNKNIKINLGPLDYRRSLTVSIGQLSQKPDNEIVSSVCKLYNATPDVVNKQFEKQLALTSNLDTHITRQTLIDKRVTDSVHVLIPLADDVLRSEQHDMCIAYQILLAKKRNDELVEYKKYSSALFSPLSTSEHSQRTASTEITSKGELLDRPKEAMSFNWFGNEKNDYKRSNTLSVSNNGSLVNPISLLPTSSGWGSLGPFSCIDQPSYASPKGSLLNPTQCNKVFEKPGKKGREAVLSMGAVPLTVCESEVSQDKNGTPPCLNPSNPKFKGVTGQLECDNKSIAADIANDELYLSNFNLTMGIGCNIPSNGTLANLYKIKVKKYECKQAPIFHPGIIFRDIPLQDVLNCIYWALLRMGFVWQTIKSNVIAAICGIFESEIKLYVRLFRAVDGSKSYVTVVRLSDFSISDFAAVEYAAKFIDLLYSLSTSAEKRNKTFDERGLMQHSISTLQPLIPSNIIFATEGKIALPLQSGSTKNRN